MNKVIKGIGIAAISAIIVYAAYFIFSTAKYAHHLDWGNKAKEYYYFFKDSVIMGFNSQANYSYIQKNNIYNHYIYNDAYYLTIWDFKNIKSLALKSITYHSVLSFSEVKFGNHETINVDSSPEITMEYGFNFDYGMRVCYDEDSRIDTTFQSKDYKAFYGNIHEMLLKNVQWDPQILFDYSNDRQYGLFIFYKKDKHFYMLIVNSDKAFDPMKLIQIFNLP